MLHGRMQPLDAPASVDIALRLGLAFLLALPVGWERDRPSRTAGLRSHALLSVGSCGVLLLAKGAGWEAQEQADALYGLLTGIGFVMTGALLASREAAGMRTAASLWVTGAIGAAVAHGAVGIAAALSLATGLTLWGPSLFRRQRQRS